MTRNLYSDGFRCKLRSAGQKGLLPSWDGRWEWYRSICMFFQTLGLRWLWGDGYWNETVVKKLKTCKRSPVFRVHHTPFVAGGLQGHPQRLQMVRLGRQWVHRVWFLGGRTCRWYVFLASGILHSGTKIYQPAEQIGQKKKIEKGYPTDAWEQSQLQTNTLRRVQLGGAANCRTRGCWGRAVAFVFRKLTVVA